MAAFDSFKYDLCITGLPVGWNPGLSKLYEDAIVPSFVKFFSGVPNTPPSGSYEGDSWKDSTLADAKFVRGINDGISLRLAESCWNFDCVAGLKDIESGWNLTPFQ